jgi:hypothetical protein
VVARSRGLDRVRGGLQVLPGVAYGEARPRARRQRLTKLGFVNDETRAAAQPTVIRRYSC